MLIKLLWPRMEARCRNPGFGFPGYDGCLPKALRSTRGRGECPRKSKDRPKDMDCFELLATVAGQLLRDDNEKHDVPTSPAPVHKLLKSEAGIAIKRNTAGNVNLVNWHQDHNAEGKGVGLGEAILKMAEESSEVMTLGDSFQEKQPEYNPIEACIAEKSQKRKFIHEPSATSSLQNQEACKPQKHEFATSLMTDKPMDISSRSKKNWGDRFNKHSIPVSCHENPEVIDSNEMEKGNVDIIRRKGSQPDGVKEPVETVMSEKDDFTVTMQEDITSPCCLVDLKGIGAGKEDGELDEEKFPRFAREVKTDLHLQGQHMLDDDNPPLVSSGSSGEAPLFMKQKCCKTTGLQRKRGVIERQGLSCSKVMDDDDNSSETTAPKTMLSKSSRLSHTKTSKSRRNMNHVTKKISARPGLKRKHHELAGKYVRVTSSPTDSRSISNLSAKESGEPQVKLSIKSFTVPKLFIDLPGSATVANLKSTVVEAAMNLFGGGISVCVLLQGNKVLDETASLLQVGISSGGKTDSLDFMLEPNPLPPTSGEDSHLVHSHAPIEPSSRYPLLSKDSISNRSCSNKHTISSEVMMEIDGHSAATHTNPPAIRSAKDDTSMFPHDSNGEAIPSSHALVLHASNRLQGLALVASENKSQNSEIGKRRIRRPFSVGEVEALVQAVETLGTGRWRDVKLRAFDQANHRTYVDLKDKWKTLVHTAHIAPRQRRGEPVPQELLDRVMHAHSYWTAHQAKRQQDVS